ncbi:MAG TPA: baseplate J/gp47 family protein, partial [Candidatus Limnocylindrales bacterium]|nr:baseplate J/gp47 family protein [Candidatus Limnocylindrales bacterium]
EGEAAASSPTPPTPPPAGTAGSAATLPKASAKASKNKSVAKAPDETQAVPVGAGAAAATVLATAAPAAPGLSAGTSKAVATPVPVTKSRRFPRVRAPVIVGAAVIALAVLVAGVGAYLLLPSATVRVTPQAEAIPPISLVVRADPDVTAPDAEHNVVPAVRLTIPVEASDTFDATGKRVHEEPATGNVEFRSFNTVSENNIPKGSIVSTEGGRKFQTVASLTLAKAEVIPPFSIKPSFGTVGVLAVKPGTAGNVPANAITVVPPDEDPTVTKVTNPSRTAGGTHEESPLVVQKDLDKAVAALTVKLRDAFNQAVEAGADAPPDATVFSDTAVLGDPTPTVDVAKLVGQEVETFDLGLTATGTVIAVDDSPVSQIAETKLIANVGADHRLVEGSVNIVPGNPTVTDGVVSFPVTARASRVKILDPAPLLASIKGLSVDEARARLLTYGEVEITTWPDWVSAIPSIDSRVTLEIGGQDGSAGPDGSEAPASSSPSATSKGSAVPASESP